MKSLPGLLVLVLPMMCTADVVVPVDSVESYVNVRQSPEAGTEIVGRLQRGVPLTLVNSIPGWHEVELDDEGTTGFVSTDWAMVIVDEVAPVASEVAPEPAVEEAEETEAAPEPVVEEDEEAEAVPEPVVEQNEMPEPAPQPVVSGAMGPPGPPGRQGLQGPPGPQGLPGAATIKGTPGYLVKFKEATVGAASQIYDNGNQVGIGTTEPKQRLEVNGNIQIHEQNSSVAGLMITQSSGETGYIMHNRASTLTIGAGSVDRMTIDGDGNVGIGVTRPRQPLEMASGAHATAGGVWTNSSSREKKENITELSVEEALAALAGLKPVQFNYRNEAGESYVGFIAEDVPELVATGDREGLSAMDIVAVLTRVIQAQQQKIEELEARIEQ